MDKLQFKPKLGQVDYTKVRWAPVINCVLKYKDKILIVQRSGKLNFYPNYWTGISGFLDDKRSLQQKVKDEIKEETGLGSKNIKSIKQQNLMRAVKFYSGSSVVKPMKLQMVYSGF